jgi:hypothetical protein
MSDRSKNLLATAAVIGMAAIASSQGLTARPAPPQQVAAASPLVPASLNR